MGALGRAFQASRHISGYQRSSSISIMSKSVSTVPQAAKLNLDRKSRQIEQRALAAGLNHTMKTLLTVAIAIAFAGSAFAAKKAPCCASDTGKAECSRIYAKLNLTPEQKSKLDAFQARCEKDGCKEESMQKFFKNAKSVLTPEQFAQLKAECGNMGNHSGKAGT
jgi:hypothetical protein